MGSIGSFVCVGHHIQSAQSWTSGSTKRVCVEPVRLPLLPVGLGAKGRLLDGLPSKRRPGVQVECDALPYNQIGVKWRLINRKDGDKTQEVKGGTLGIMIKPTPT